MKNSVLVTHTTLVVITVFYSVFGEDKGKNKINIRWNRESFDRLWIRTDWDNLEPGEPVVSSYTSDIAEGAVSGPAEPRRTSCEHLHSAQSHGSIFRFPELECSVDIVDAELSFLPWGHAFFPSGYRSKHTRGLTQFEISAVSEASIGQTQRYCCQYGFVDHVITPNGGLVWMVAGDALDRYVTVPVENRTHGAIRILARVGLNPPQSFANLMIFYYPWRHENPP